MVNNSIYTIKNSASFISHHYKTDLSCFLLIRSLLCHLLPMRNDGLYFTPFQNWFVMFFIDQILVMSLVTNEEWWFLYTMWGIQTASLYIHFCYLSSVKRNWTFRWYLIMTISHEIASVACISLCIGWAGLKITRGGKFLGKLLWTLTLLLFLK